MFTSHKKSLAVLSLVIALLLTAPVIIYKKYLSPRSHDGEKILVEISPGMTTKEIATMLKSKRIIKSERGFLLYAKYSGMSKKLKAGEFRLDPTKSVKEVFDEIIRGKVILRSLTIPEGLTVKEVAHLVEKNGMSDSASIMSASKDPAILSKYGIKKSAEGYLYPETYNFDKDVTAGEIVDKMLSTFMQKVKPVKDKYQPTSRLSFKEIVILASIIEKETANREEYSLISAVYNNRLKKRMKLQADPTVIYGLPNYNGNIRKKDLSYDHPYNTYVHYGLPVGPIANPSASAIESAYNPAVVDYLYFVATRAGGRHKFSKTYKEHAKAVRKYQLKRRY